MRALPPLTITASMLTDTSVPEEAPAAYSAGATYATDDEVSVATGTARDVYASLIDSNIGNTPASSPASWQYLGRTYQTYTAGTYAEDDIVLDLPNHRLYQSLVGSNSQALTHANWLDIGPSNRWAPFDLERNTGAVAPSPMSFVLTPGQRVDSIGLVGIIADTVTITVTDDDLTVYSYEVDLSSRNVTDWYEYFYEPFSFKTAQALFNLPPMTTAIVAVTLERATGDVSLGGLLIGRSVYLGTTQHNAENDALNFSTIERDEFGTAILIPRRTKPKSNQQVRCSKAAVNKAIALRTQLNAVPALWSGLDDADSGYFEPLLILGIYKRFTVAMDRPEEALITLELEEV
jgi:hypothetical protein